MCCLRGRSGAAPARRRSMGEAAGESSLPGLLPRGFLGYHAAAPCCKNMGRAGAGGPLRPRFCLALRAAAESGDVPHHERWAFPVLTFPAEVAVRMAAEEPACAGWVRPGGKSRDAVSETGESVPASESAEREAFLPLVRSGQIGVGRERAPGALFFSAGGRGEVSGLPGRSTGSFSGKGERARAQKKVGEQFRVSGFLKGVAAARNRSACGGNEAHVSAARRFFEEEKPAPSARRQGEGALSL